MEPIFKYNPHHSIKSLVLTLGVIFLSSFKFNSPNINQELDYSLHAKYIYHFTKYFEWPTEKESGSFIIGIYGNKDLYGELKKISELKKINNRNIVVVDLSLEDDPSNCQMVFIGRASLINIDKIMLKIGNKPIMVLGDKMGYSKRGLDVNFIIKDDLLRFELSASALESKKIKTAKEIKSLALAVK
ncbi:MAG: YfiR family protein [Bacteroidetes bacterium]|nr:YfiR family protein [Bacteroidota bacterium]